MTLQIKQQVSLLPHNSMGVPSTAGHLVAVVNVEELQQALQYARQQKLRSLVLGEGSNTIFAGDFDGLIILNQIRGIALLEESEEELLVRVSAGENWHDWVSHCLQQGWHGLENLALIPGLVGAAPIQNIGAYGVELDSRVVAVDIINVISGTPQSLSNAQCEFAYRDSVFKHALSGKAVVTSVTFRLSKYFEPVLDYPALKKHLGSSAPSAKNIFSAVCAIRSSKLPMPAEIPNAGSFFKNPVVDSQVFVALQKKFPEIVAFEHQADYKLAAAWMIEQAGWKEKEIDGVHVHPEQALVIVNPKHKSGGCVLALASEIQDSIRDMFDVELEIEPRVY